MKSDFLKTIRLLLLFMMVCHSTEIKNKGPEISNPPSRVLELKSVKSNLSRNKNDLETTENYPRELNNTNQGINDLMNPFKEAQEPGADQNGSNGQQSNGFNQGGSSFGNFMPAMGAMMAGNMMLSNTMMNPSLQGFSTPALPQRTLLPDPDDLDDNGFDFGSNVDLLTEVYDDASGLRVASKCTSVKTQAIEIANRIMKKQNTKIFRELVSYLVKSKFLIGLTEIKLARSLRKRIFSLMGAFSTLNQNQFNFVGHSNNRIDESGTKISDSDDNDDLYDKSFANKAYPVIDNFIKKDYENGSLKSLNAKI